MSSTAGAATPTPGSSSSSNHGKPTKTPKPTPKPSQGGSGGGSDHGSSHGSGSHLNDTASWVTFGISAAFGVAACVISLRWIWKHLTHYTQPAHQRYIVRILLMVPIYSFYSLASIYFEGARLYFAVLRDAYESYVLYGFFVLCMNYAGGVEVLSRKLLEQPEMKLPFPLHRYTVQPNEKLLQTTRRGVLQYVLIRPTLAIISIIAEAFGVYHDGNFSPKSVYLWNVLITNLSVTAAVYCLVLLYLAISEEIKPYKPVLKFACIKIVLFFSFWQDVIFALLLWIGWIPRWGEWNKDEVADALSNLLVCFEMFVVSILQTYAFPYDLYAVKAMSQAPLVHEVERATSVVSGLQNTVNPKDVMQDTLDLFVPNQIQSVPQSVRQLGTTIIATASTIAIAAATAAGGVSDDPNVQNSQTGSESVSSPNSSLGAGGPSILDMTMEEVAQTSIQVIDGSPTTKQRDIEKDDQPMLLSGPGDAFPEDIEAQRKAAAASTASSSAASSVLRFAKKAFASTIRSTEHSSSSETPASAGYPSTSGGSDSKKRKGKGKGNNRRERLFDEEAGDEEEEEEEEDELQDDVAGAKAPKR